jgi:FkbM family methyltransferase
MGLRRLTDFRFLKRLPSDFGGEKMYVTGRADLRVFKPGWDGCAYDLQLVGRNLVEEGMSVWDIGANLGIMSVFAAAKIGVNGAVYALEADPNYADLIFKTSQRLSATYQPINVLCAAIADKSGVLEFGVSRQGHARNKLIDYADDAFEIEARKMVAAVRGDDLLQYWRAPDFVKMDVEGAEFDVLSGCETLLGTVRPVFYIEVSPQNQDRVSELFRQHDYRIFHLQGDGNEKPVETCSFYTIARPR